MRSGAPENRDKNRPDVSRADFTWCMTAITWGWSIEDTAERLMKRASKPGKRRTIRADDRAKCGRRGRAPEEKPRLILLVVRKSNERRVDRPEAYAMTPSSARVGISHIALPSTPFDLSSAVA